MLENVLKTYSINLVVAEALVKDLSPDQMCQQPSGLINHPAWSLGHLVLSGHRLCGLIGLESELPAGWKELFKAGAPPLPTVGSYPGKAELLDAHRHLHEQISAAAPSIDKNTLNQPYPSERARQYFRTIGDRMVFMMTGHEMNHLGQIAAWRRAMGLKPAF